MTSKEVTLRDVVDKVRSAHIPLEVSLPRNNRKNKEGNRGRSGLKNLELADGTRELENIFL